MFVKEGKVGKREGKGRELSEGEEDYFNQLSEKASVAMSCLSCNLVEKEPARRRA